MIAFHHHSISSRIERY